MTSTGTLVTPPPLPSAISTSTPPTLKQQSQQRFNTCIKFIPQAYNTNKCQQCFNLKETHSLDALAEFSKSNRKLLKFGYLFIAPPDLELNKTKRWQWRFFLFYDDGELTYSLDDNPLTLPQGRINLRNCDEIIELISSPTQVNTDSTSISYPNCLKLKFTNNKDIYIAAGNYEEIIKWRDVLMLNSKQIVLTEKQPNSNKLRKETTRKHETEDDEYQGNVEDGGDDTDIDDDDYEYNEYSNRTNTNTNLKLKKIIMKKQKASTMISSSKKEDSLSISSNSKANDQQKDDTDDGGTSRRLSYKEDDLLRKQRLKENLNQLLIEYKHEEEAQLKKSSRFSMQNSTMPTPKFNNRISLDSCYPPPPVTTTNKLTHKTSAFSLVVPPQQQTQPQPKQQMATNPNSAFRPVTNSNKTHETQRPQTVDLVKKGCTSASSSEASSWSSSSSTSSSSSSNSPPKTRQSNLISINTDQNIYKKPCLISPRKQESTNKLDESYASLLASNPGLMLSSPNSNKTLTIKVRNETEQQQQQNQSPTKENQQNIEIIDLTNTNTSNPTNKTRRLNTKQTNYNNLAGYLWKTKDYSTNSNKQTNDNQFERYWFSLNTNLCCLIYWNDKLEQDLGKFPIGKYELAKCCQLYQQHQQSEFKLTFHQNTISLHLRANTIELTINWYEAIKHTIDNLSSFCIKCKPKLVVNPMPLSLGSQSMSSPNQSVLTSSSQQQQQQQQQPPPLPTSQPPSQTKLNDSNETTLVVELEQLKQKYDSLLKENADLNSKFKLLEQIHLEAIGEYDNQQSQLFNQLDDMQLKLNKNDQEVNELNKRLLHSNKQNETNLIQIKHLNEQIQKHKEQLQLKEKEIDKIISNNTDLDQFDSINESYSASTSRANWNKEVKNLDARITDVLGKLKERELNLSTTSSSNLLIASSPNDDFKLKYEKCHQQLVEAQQKILQLKNTNQTGTDFSDDLAKVLMSKEEVITQLEKHLKEKEKQIQALTSQLNEEIQQTCKFQDAFNLEQSRTNELNLELKNLNSEQTAFTDEIDSIREQLNKTTSLMDSLQSKLDQTQTEKETLELELKNLNEYSRNEIETLQEEIKTLEYKLVHSQRQAQEYQTILEELDVSNTNLVNHLLNELNMTNVNLNESSIQGKLKKNQSNISNLIQQLIKKKQIELDEVSQQMNELTKELNELKEENADLNDHIYSIDVFMREKDQQCDQLQKENQDLVEKVKHLDSEATLNQTNDYTSFLNKLKHLLTNRTHNLNDFLRFIVNMSLQMIDVFKLADSNDTSIQIDEELIKEKLNEQFIIEYLTHLFHEMNNDDAESTILLINDLNELSKLISNELNLTELKESINDLVKFINSQDLMQFNCQIVTYMAEQLVHKASLNGNFKFACDFIRKKLHSNEQIESNETTSILSTTSEQDEKIFKLASELLLSDEQQLRKLSSQVLNEAQHMQQLNWVLNALRKLRWKHLKLKSKDKLEIVLASLKKLDDSYNDSMNQEDEQNLEDELSSGVVNKKATVSLLDNQMNLILDVIKEIFSQHKCQINDQLIEMKKLMSITPDNDDLITHLQNENALLQQELTDLKNKKTNSSNWLSLTTNTSLTANNSALVNNTTSHHNNHQGTSQLRKFSSSYATSKSP